MEPCSKSWEVPSTFLESGEPGGIRTLDPRLKRPLLYQLSYRLAGHAGIARGTGAGANVATLEGNVNFGIQVRYLQMDEAVEIRNRLSRNPQSALDKI